jgi:hypothetical protein
MANLSRTVAYDVFGNISNFDFSAKKAAVEQGGEVVHESKLIKSITCVLPIQNSL